MLSLGLFDKNNCKLLIFVVGGGVFNQEKVIFGHKKSWKTPKANFPLISCKKTKSLIGIFKVCVYYPY